MRVLLLAAVDPCVPNASVTHLDGLAGALREAGHGARVHLPRPTSGMAPVLSATDVPYDLRYIGYGARFAVPRFASFLAHIRPALRRIDADRVDLVYVRAGVLSAPLTRFITARRPSLPLMTEHNGWIADELRAIGHSRFLARMAERLQVADARASTLVRCVTPGLSNRFRDAGIPARRLLVLGNGTNLERFRPLPRHDALSAMALPPERSYLGFIGNLAPWQGLHVAIEALGLIRAKRPDVELLIVGDGPERVRLEAQAARLGLAGAVHFLGSVAPNDANRAINAFDIALAPFTVARNQSIGLSPLKIRDYAAAGRCILASDVDGVAPPDDRDWIRLVEPESAPALARAAHDLLDAPDTRGALGCKARRHAEHHFGWSAVVDGLESAVARLTRGGE